MIARFLFKNPPIMLLLLCVIILAGVSSLLTMPRLEDPVLGKRVAVVSTAYPGADARRVESLVTMRIEEQLRGISEIDEVRSTSRTGISNVVIELRDEVDDFEAAWSIVSDRVDEAAIALPEGCRAPALEIFPLKAFAAIVAVQWSGPDPANESIVRKLANQLRRRIGNLEGAESVRIFGDPGEEFSVEIDPATLAGLEISTAAVAAQVADNWATQPAGFIRGSRSELLVDVAQGDAAAERLKDSFIRFGRAGQLVKLSEIADVRRRLTTPLPSRALVNDRTAIVLGVFVDDQYRVDRWSVALEGLLADFEQEYGATVQVDVIFSQQKYISARLHALLRSLLLGAAAVTGVVFLLMGWRSMIVVGATLPLSSLLVFTGMRWLGIPIHQMSVTGLIVALGLLIDNAIVIVEDVRSRIYGGQPVDQAITAGIRHLAMPLFGSTLTTALAFMPIAILPGPPGEFVGSIAVSVILAIGSSFLLAMTVVPALLAAMRVDAAAVSFMNYGVSSRPFRWVYQWSLGLVFRYPVLGILLGAALPTIGYLAARELPEQFFPPSDRKEIQIEIELPAREPIENTLATAQEISKIAASKPQIRRIHWFLGASAPTFYYNVVPRRRGTPFYGQAIVELTADAPIQETVRSLQTDLDASHPECRALVRQLEQGPPFDAPIELRVSGPDLQTLQQVGSQLRLLLSQTSNVIHTRSDFEETIPKLVVKLNAEDATSAKLTRSDVAQLLYTTLEGAPAGEMLDGEEKLPIRIKMAGLESEKLQRLAALQLPTMGPPLSTGPPQAKPPAPARANLSAVADLQLGSELAAIARIDGRRTNEIKAYLRAGVLPSTVLAEFNRRLIDSNFQLPAGYNLAFQGERAERTHAVQNLVANAAVLGTLMILTLVIAFRSVRSALIIVAVGALAAGLGPLALYGFGFPFGFMAIVGTMGLVGVAINDSIVVLAAIQENQHARRGDIQQLTNVVTGCTRHIIATTLTTIVGFTPLILGGGGFWPPLAITIAGGVGGATFLALYFVPALHQILHGRQHAAVVGSSA